MGPCCQGWRLGLERCSGRGRERTIVSQERIGGRRIVRRGRAGTGTWLRERRSARELATEVSQNGCPDIRWSTDLLRGRRNAKRRRIVLHPFLARLQRLVDPILNDIVATLNAQRSNIGTEELMSFLLWPLGECLDEMSQR